MVEPAAPTESRVTPWRWSRAKKLLYEDINNGLCNGKKPSEVYKTRSEYQRYEKCNFETNFRNLKKAIENEKARVASDAAAFTHDKALFAVLKVNSKPYPIWQGSSAARLLKKHVADKLHEVMKPKLMWTTFAEYQEYPLDVFRKHVYDQSIRKDKERSYWLNKAKKKEAEKSQRKSRKTTKHVHT
jgi:c-di-AMP phosphodiesterase-like protein